MDEEDLDALTADFNALRSSIQTEMRRIAEGVFDDDGPSTSTSIKAPSLPPMSSGPTPTIAKPPPLPPPTMGMPEDEEIPSFYNLRAKLHSRVSSEMGVPPPPKPAPTGVPLMQLPGSNTVSLPMKPGKVPSASDFREDDMRADFDSLNASLTSKLRNAAWDGIRAAEQRVVTGRSTAPPPSRTPAWMSMPADDDDEDEIALDDHKQISAAAAALPATTVLAAAPDEGGGGENVVRLSATRPGAVGGPTVLAAMDNYKAVAACQDNAPKFSSAASGRVPLCMPATSRILATEDVMMSMPSRPVLDSEVALQRESYQTTTDHSSEVMFGHLAMTAALDSHKAHYNRVRSNLRTKR